MKRIAIIPARSGSKGLKNKNILELNGKPLMAYSIEAAVRSNLFSRVIVSTDSEEYGVISTHFGAEVMYRSEDLSDDKATTFMVIEDVIKRIENDIDYFILLQPTSPLRDEYHIKEAAERFESCFENYDFLVSVKEAGHSAALIKPIEEDGSLKHFDADFSDYRRQAYKEYCPNGAIFIGKPMQYLARKHFFGDRGLSYIMSEFDSVDIDTRLDYELACLCMQLKLKGEQL